MDSDKVKKIVRSRYGKVAKNQTSCCGTSTKSKTSCCNSSKITAEEVSKTIGYSKEELESTPDASNMGLGCGNPTAFASIQEGEIVLDLGSGGGLDCFLAAQKVGSKGRVIGVDMTPDMIDLARDNANKNDIKNVEFRLGEIENLPVANEHIDIIISNCVINLSPEKQKVFNEAYRVLKPGGRFVISDIVLLKDLPESLKNDETLLAGCVAGAELKENYLSMIREAGFENIKVKQKTDSIIDVSDRDDKPTEPLLVVDGEINSISDFNEIKEDINTIQKSIQSITVTAFKPK